MNDLPYLGIADAGRRFRSGELSPVEFTQDLLSRIERLDPTFDAFIRTTPEIALREAKKAQDELASGLDRGPMHGIPYALKDIVDVAGLPTTCHSKLMTGKVASTDATLVKRLAHAGAVLLGKTALHEFATGGPAFDLPWPPARNPWNRSLHPGGSSSGSATALAAGFTPAAIGTDTGGSIRNPSTCCGLVGMKPTFNMVSCDGVFPLAASLDHAGPMTRSVEDNALLLDAIAEPRMPDGHPKPDFLAGMRAGIRGLRIGVIAHFHTEDSTADDRQVAAFDAAVQVLRDLGAQVAPIRLSPLSIWDACGRAIQQAEQYALHGKWLKERAHDYCAISRTKLGAGAAVRIDEYVRATQDRRRLCDEFSAVLRNFDAVIALSGFELPCRIDDQDAIARTYGRHARMPFNLTGTPALAIPTGFTEDGLPLGMQIASGAYAEPMLYRIAWAYESETLWAERKALE